MISVEFLQMESFYQYGKEFDNLSHPGQVLDLACKVITPILKKKQAEISHLIVATTCPDSIAPSVGQNISHHFTPFLDNSHVIDIVQGCAGGVSALLLGCTLTKDNPKQVMVVMVDAAKKACDKSSKNYQIFGNGAFACLLSQHNSNRGLIHYKSRQYHELTEVVHVKLGHDADIIFNKHQNELFKSPRKYLGLEMNNDLAISLLKKAKGFYDEFIEELKIIPDVMILHQVNPKIVSYLETIFNNNNIRFINISNIAGNCGAASVGIALKYAEEMVSMISFKRSGEYINLSGTGSHDT